MSPPATRSDLRDGFAERAAGGGDDLRVAHPPAAVAERISAISPSQARSIMSRTSSKPSSPPK